MEKRKSQDRAVRALSVRQPWAYAILHLGKNVENRSWRTNHRGKLWIHASATMGPDERREARNLRLDPTKLPKGQIVGLVEVEDCVCKAKSKWAHPGMWHWILKNPRALKKPIEFKGKVGFMLVPKRLVPASFR